MKLIIDVPEETYKDIQARDWKNGELIFSDEWKAIHNGIPLPKGHGRLIDANDLKWQFDKRDELNGFTENIIAGTPTIIEADRERNE